MYFLDKQKKSLTIILEHLSHKMKIRSAISLKKAFLSFRIGFSLCFCYEIPATALAGVAGRFCVGCVK
jgi:hypothetical protein